MDGRGQGPAETVRHGDREPPADGDRVRAELQGVLSHWQERPE